MNFAFTEEEEAFRAEVRDFLTEALPPDWGVRNVGDDEDGGGGDAYDFQWEFNRKLAQKGWLVVAWPKEYGGQEWSYFKQVVYAEEVVKHQAPRGDSIGPRMVGSLLIGHGTEAQKERFLPPIAKADVRWCQLFSEPNAGSDLAGLETVAEDHGDYFVVNGGKIWSSFAHVADWGFLLARTNKDAPKHQGLSYFFLDMKTPGVTVKPLISMVGVHRFNQVFFDDVRIPRDCLVGPKDQGWMLSRNVLNVERSGISAAAGSKRMLLDLIAYAESPESRVRWTDERRREAADLLVRAEVARGRAYNDERLRRSQHCC